jgi:hypothetical protein
VIWTPLGWQEVKVVSVRRTVGSDVETEQKPDDDARVIKRFNIRKTRKLNGLNWNF